MSRMFIVTMTKAIVTLVAELYRKPIQPNLLETLATLKKPLCLTPKLYSTRFTLFLTRSEFLSRCLLCDRADLTKKYRQCANDWQLLVTQILRSMVTIGKKFGTQGGRSKGYFK